MARVRLHRSHLNGLIPSPLIPTIRSYFTSQGVTGTAVDNDGNLNPQAVIALLYDTVEFRSSLFPPGAVVYNLKNVAPNPETARLLDTVRPAVILHSAVRGDQVLFAPRGVPTGQASEVKGAASNLGFGIGAVALGLVLVGAAIMRSR